jgi:hypothetical protein
LYHSLLLIALAVLVLTRNLSLFALIAFVPVLVRVFRDLLKPATKLHLQRAGLLEMAYSLIFLIFITLTFR